MQHGLQLNLPWYPGIFVGSNCVHLVCPHLQVELLPDVLPTEQQGSPAGHSRQRCALLMRMPLGAEHFKGGS
jgi:hypothetical protein